MKLNKKEVTLWQNPFEMYFQDNGKNNDIEYFILTNQNIRFQYIKKLSLFKKEFIETLIPLDDIEYLGEPSIIYRDTEEDTIELSIITEDNSYTFEICYSRKKVCIKQLEEFKSLVDKYLIKIKGDKPV